jgi:putative flippase GtrA
MTDLKLGPFKLSVPLLRFLAVGFCAFGVEYATFYILYAELAWHLYIANSLSFILGMITSFSLNRMWTFISHKDYSKKVPHQLSYYAALAIINFILTNVIVETLASISLSPKIGKLIAMITTSLWNYVLYKFIIFSYKVEN